MPDCCVMHLLDWSEEAVAVSTNNFDTHINGNLPGCWLC